MTAKLKIKKNDKVVVIAGKDKGRTGAVLRVMPKENRVVVSGVNVVARHTKPTQQSGGGIVRKEASIHVSNVAILDPKENKPTRVTFKTLNDGRKVRVARRSGEVIE